MCSGIPDVIEVIRCPWAKPGDYTRYHDEEWGVELREPRALFELLILEGAQAGLSWETVLKKRPNYREAFHHFDPEIIAKYSARDIRRLMANPGIIRNRLKIESTIANARAFLQVRNGSAGRDQEFSHLIWSFVDGVQKVNAWSELKYVPAKTPESIRMSRDLGKRGFRFIGPTICYAFMQAAGLVNDHLTSCFRHSQCAPSSARLMAHSTSRTKRTTSRR
jgi:DNA-3-methyladenine glycosylase I